MCLGIESKKKLKAETFDLNQRRVIVNVDARENIMVKKSIELGILRSSEA